MSVLWVLPVVVVAIGLVAVTFATRQAALAATELRSGFAELMDVRAALVALADEAGDARHEIDRMRARPGTRDGGR